MNLIRPLGHTRHLSSGFALAAVLFGCFGASSSTGATIAAADSQRLFRRFERIRHSSTVTIFQVDGWARDCVPSTFFASRVIDCHPIVQEVGSPSRSWRDSIVAVLMAPGALVPPEAKLCQCNDDIVLRFTSKFDTTTVWACTHCGTIGIPTPVSVMGFDLARGVETFRRLVYSVLPAVDYESRAEFQYYDDPPVLIERPDVPPPLRVRDPASVDSVVFQVRIRRDGRVDELQMKRSVPKLDSLAADYVSHFVYKPALSNNRPVAVRFVIALKVPRSAR